MCTVQYIIYMQVFLLLDFDLHFVFSIKVAATNLDDVVAEQAETEGSPDGWVMKMGCGQRTEKNMLIAEASVVSFLILFVFDCRNCICWVEF